MKIKTLFLTLMICGACYCSAAETPAPAAQAAPASAETAAPANPKAQQSSWKSMIVPVGLIVVMILLFSRANKKQQKQRQEMMNKIVKGTKVLLNSGVYGKIVEVKENDFVVEIAENVRVLVVKEGIARVEEEKKEEAK